MRHGSLFSGIGGFDLAAEWMGWENVFHCEWNEFGQKILKHYWPNAISYGDITKTDFSIHRGSIDIISGGFPCQPYSAAGKRKGTADDRHLWPEMLRAIREISPRYIVGENVRGLTNWNGGMVFDQVQADLEAEGFEVLPFLLPACAINAPHRRDRIWFVAHATGDENIGRGSGRLHAEPSGVDVKGASADTPSDRRQRERQGTTTEEGLQSGPGSAGKLEGRPKGLCGTGDATYPQPTGLERPDGIGMEGTVQSAQCATPNPNGRRQPSEEYRKEKPRQFTETGIPGNWQDFPTQSPVCGRDDELSGRLDGITFPKWRNESIKGYGNAVVPGLVLQIFKAIAQWGNVEGKDINK